MSLSPRESRLAIITVQVVLVLGAFLVLKPRYKQWENDQERVRESRVLIAMDEEKAAERPELLMELDELMEALPVHPEGVNVVSDMMRTIERLSRNSGLTVSSVYPDQERKDPERNLFEFSIRCDWAGELPHLTRFLYTMQSEGAVMDISSLNVKPSKRQGYLEGKLTIDFAYRRVDPADMPAAPEPEVETAEEAEGLRVTPTP